MCTRVDRERGYLLGRGRPLERDLGGVHIRNHRNFIRLGDVGQRWTSLWRFGGRRMGVMGAGSFEECSCACSTTCTMSTFGRAHSSTTPSIHEKGRGGHGLALDPGAGLGDHRRIGTSRGHSFLRTIGVYIMAILTTSVLLNILFACIRGGRLAGDVTDVGGSVSTTRDRGMDLGSRLRTLISISRVSDCTIRGLNVAHIRSGGMGCVSSTRCSMTRDIRGSSARWCQLPGADVVLEINLSNSRGVLGWGLVEFWVRRGGSQGNKAGYQFLGGTL